MNQQDPPLTRQSASRYSSEKLLVDAFIAAITATDTPWSFVRLGCEFAYQRGKTDVVGVSGNGTIFAFEAKLEKWKFALQQAYRNSCFAHLSYVVLPKPTALRAASCLAEFERRGVGLCYVEQGRVVIMHEAPLNEPIQPWLSLKAIAHSNT